MPAPETVAEAIEQVALGMVKREKDRDRETEYLPIDDMIAAEKHLAGQAAASKPHFGLRMTKCIPPGGG